jgi:hypothetical protein
LSGAVIPSARPTLQLVLASFHDYDSRVVSYVWRFAKSPWAGALLVFSSFQWIWNDLWVSLAGVALLLAVGIVLPRFMKPRDPEKDAESIRLLGEWLWVTPLGLGCIWASYALRFRPERVGWALVAAGIFLLFALTEFVERRERVRADRAQTDARTPG